MILAGGLVIFVMGNSIPVYQKFTDQPQTFKLDFLFCFNEDTFKKNYRLSESRTKNQIQLQLKFLNFVRVFGAYFSGSFFLFFLKMAYDNVLITTKFSSTFLYTIVAIKLAGHLALYVSFAATVVNVFISFYEIMLGCQFLSFRLDDLTEQILNLLSTKKKIGTRFLNNRMQVLSLSYSEVLRLQAQMNRHFDQALKFPLVILVFGIVYPALVIFEPRPDEKKLVIAFYCINHFFINFFVFIIVYFNTKFLNSNQSFLGSLRFVSKYAGLKTSIKVMNIHLLNPEPKRYSFTFRHIYPYTFDFFIHVSSCRV